MLETILNQMTQHDEEIVLGISVIFIGILLLYTCMWDVTQRHDPDHQRRRLWEFLQGKRSFFDE